MGLPFDSFFDTLQPIIFGTTTQLMGYKATWLPSQNAFNMDFGEDFLTGPQIAMVHYKDATMGFDLTGQGTKFDQPRYQMEYLLPDFLLLKQAADDSGQSEKIVIEVRGEAREFDIVSVDTKYDGKTCVAFLNPVGD